MSLRTGKGADVSKDGRLTHALNVGLGALTVNESPASATVPAAAPSPSPFQDAVPVGGKLAKHAEEAMVLLQQQWKEVKMMAPKIVHWTNPDAAVEDLTFLPVLILAKAIQEKQYIAIVKSDDKEASNAFAREYELETDAGCYFHLIVTPVKWHLQLVQKDSFFGENVVSFTPAAKHEQGHTIATKDGAINNQVSYDSFLLFVKVAMQLMLTDLRANAGNVR